MVIGHKKQIKLLEKILQSNDIPQSYLFIGPKGVGKFFVANLFAKSLIEGFANQNLKMSAENFLQKKQNIDLEILQPEIIEKKGVIKIKNIEVEKVREAQKNLSLFPAIGKFRVLIIDDAQKLNLASQNTLLKTLEEPNKTSIIILVVNEEEKILNTIISRCRKINFNLVGLDEIKDGLKKEENNNNLDKVAIYSMGRPGEAKYLLQNKNILKEKDIVIQELRKIGTMNNVEKFELAEKYAKNLPETLKKMELWVWFLRIQAYKNIGENQKLKLYYNIISKMEDTLKKIKKIGLNNRLILENLFLEL
ncbi:MAG TPA: DNA polymerase III subunit delta' [Candidatus Moranbacteria bacterium]|nr:DNA polymerase III subunit delta' [Candidatus Moranbacteria bacterium]